MRIAAALLFALMVAGSADPEPVAILLHGRATVARFLERLPDLRTPSYPPFLEEVRRRTLPGDSIAVLVPWSDWTSYSYAYYRASYFLAGRRVVPLVDPDGRKRLDRLGSAEWVAVWDMNVSLTGYRTVWKGRDGSLAKNLR